MKARGQTTLETAVLFIIVIAAFVAMFGYLKRSIQGDWRNKADSFSEGQYDPNAEDSTSPGSDWTVFDTANTQAFLNGTAANTKVYRDSSGLDVLKVEGWGNAE